MSVLPKTVINYINQQDNRYFYTDIYNDCPESVCNDFVGAFVDAIDYAKVYANETGLTIYVNNFGTGKIEDVVYPDLECTHLDASTTEQTDTGVKTETVPEYPAGLDDCITAYDYNRVDNTLTVTYGYGVTRKYYVDCTPKSVQTYIINDIVYGILFEYKHKISSDIKNLKPLISNNHDLRVKYYYLCSNLNYISDLLLRTPENLIKTLCNYHILLAAELFKIQTDNNMVKSDNNDLRYIIGFLENDYNFLHELVLRFDLPLDVYKPITLKHLLLIRFAKSEKTESTESNIGIDNVDITSGIPP